MRIAHISDLHLNLKLADSNLEKLCFLLSRFIESKYDHLVISGDLSDSGREEDFAIFRRVLSEYGLLNGDRVTLVIGNHDIFGGIEQVEEIFSFPERCRNIDYDKKVISFNSYFEETFSNTVYRSKSNNGYPFAKLIDGTLIVGANSISRYSSVKNRFASNGFVADDQLAEMKTIFDRFHTKQRETVLVIHHHFNKMSSEVKQIMHALWSKFEKQTVKMHKKKRLFKLFREYGLDMVLHGHMHETEYYEIDGTHFFSAGGSVRNVSPGTLEMYYLTTGGKGKKPLVDLQRYQFTASTNRYMDFLFSNFTSSIHSGHSA